MLGLPSEKVEKTKISFESKVLNFNIQSYANIASIQYL